MAEFVPGFRVFAPRANAPEWIKADIVIDVRAMRDWLADNPHNEVRLQIKESRDGGKLYAQVNDYGRADNRQDNRPPPPPFPNPKPQDGRLSEMTTNRAYNAPPREDPDDIDSDIPF